MKQPKLIDLCGQKFNKLTPIKFLSFSKRGQIWLCKCECKKEIETTSYKLRKGMTTQCKSCHNSLVNTNRWSKKFKDYSGKIFKNWTVLSRDETRKSLWWICKCKCGNIESKHINTLRKIKTGRCKKCLFLGINIHPMTYLFLSAKNGAKRRNIKFDITKEYLLEIIEKQNYKCALSGVDIICDISNKKTLKNTNASIDRIDSNKGYEIGNIQFVHYLVNQMKWTLSQSEFIDWCKLIVSKS